MVSGNGAVTARFKGITEGDTVIAGPAKMANEAEVMFYGYFRAYVRYSIQCKKGADSTEDVTVAVLVVLATFEDLSTYSRGKQSLFLPVSNICFFSISNVPASQAKFCTVYLKFLLRTQKQLNRKGTARACALCGARDLR